MDLTELLSYKWSIMTPEFIILGVATLLSLLDLFMPKTVNRKILGWIGVTGILAALVSLFSLFGQGAESILYDTFRLDSFAKAFKLLLLLGAALVMILATSYEPKEGFADYRGEFFYLFLAALLGTMIMSSSGDLITLFVGLELLSIPSYILAGLHKKNTLSNESSMKYVINGGISTAITLFGMSYVYGLTGTTNLLEMARGLLALTNPQHIYLMGLALFMIFVGLSFKLATAPFHMWAPDVYQGAPTPVTAFLSVVSKTAGFIILIRIMLVVFLSTPSSDIPNSMPLFMKVQDYIAFLAAATMIIGNVVALRQKNIKRLFAYSSIAQAGYLLVVVASLSVFIFDTLWFYLGAYLFMNLGAFAIIQLITQKTGSEDISQFAGLYRKAPILSVSMAVFILSLAGIPGTSGFIGKLNIFMGALAVEPARYVLVSIMIATTVVSYFYYFGVLVQMFFRPAADPEAKIKLPVGLGVVIGVCVFATVLFGVAPSIAFDFLQGNFNQFSDFFQ
ncbi:NADH-quinone oxidoreductase subunit NuoN [Bacillus sp. DTU_2020_1000418_1_SI_GHA_SEK_038]|uniref:NADH-quinone oxidoreductase subunit NuoN n=1 Tax=Bacillus sp. DTU_2020_1000418_1_SI_GHA_SEK_038 TaxID=3077585 RepID=UPI0028ED564A|nr:NADH-quinone oxidoreductase subunit NuoN [Bacillus sp. DTU_2020_1000418_1_SI_GHA_SEK_038]WNS75258.1 NADH-quinone oxidoreductase subunit NuoN [Bacillus sp. DTU_2020_1000418_1_SI_GHA_SEK_038]